VRRQIKKRRCFDELHIVAQIKIDRCGLKGLFTRTMDQVEAERLVAETRFQSNDGGFDTIERQPGSPEIRKHSSAANGLDDFRRSDAVRHGPGHIRKSQTMIGTK
jgi:hypothetical protein